MQMKKYVWINHVEYFKYIASYIRSTTVYVNISINNAWAALNSMNIICKLNINTRLKRNCVRATVESVLVYGSVTCTLTTSLEKHIDGIYTRILRAVTNKS